MLLSTDSPVDNAIFSVDEFSDSAESMMSTSTLQMKRHVSIVVYTDDFKSFIIRIKLQGVTERTLYI